MENPRKYLEEVTQLSLQSSYSQNNFGEVFFNTILAHKPAVSVELGVLHGYSSLHIAAGLKTVHEMTGHYSKLASYDIFEDYPYNHSRREEVQKSIDRASLGDYIELVKEDAFSVHNRYPKESVDFLHVDLSNDGEVFTKVFNLWDPVLKPRGLLLFEGGSLERDKVEWMKKYQKLSIKEAIEKNKDLNRRYVYGTYSRFPSLTAFIKKLNFGE